MKEKSELKKRAGLAKQRLKMGYWQNIREEKEEAIEQAKVSGGNVELINELTRARILRDENTQLQSKKAKEEEEFYIKVKALLQSDENSLNPLGELMDKRVFECLDNASKQRYVLTLAQKFREMKERIENENKINYTSR